MRELGNTQFRELIAPPPDELRIVRRSIEILSRVADGRPGTATTIRRNSHEPPLRAGRRQAERHAAPGRRSLRRGYLRLEQPAAGAAAGHRLPGHHRRRSAARRLGDGRREPGRRTDRTRHRRRAPARNLQSTSANSVALVVAQFSFGTDVKETQAAIEDSIASAGLPDSVEPDVSALNINASLVVIASIAATNEDGLEAAADIARTEIIPEILGLEGVASADLTGGLEQQVLVTLDPDKLAETGITVAQISGVFQANDLTLPSGQLSTDGAKVPVSTSGELGSSKRSRSRRRSQDARDPAARPGGLDAARRLRRPRRIRRPERVAGAARPPLRSPCRRPTPVTLGDLGTVEPEVSRRPVTRAPMVSRRSPSPSPRRRPRTPSMSPGRSSSRSRMPAPGTPTR